VTYAAYAAARSAIVWLPTDASEAVKQERIHLAAAQALAPYASGDPLHVAAVNRSAYVGDEADQNWFQAYERYSAGRAPSGLLHRKRQYALGATKVTYVKVGPIPSDVEQRGTRPLQVTVTYEKPIVTPLMGLVFGHRAPFAGAGFYSRTIEATAVLHLEGPKSATRTLGIRYDSWNL
jgi:hypothetical protein